MTKEQVKFIVSDIYGECEQDASETSYTPLLNNMMIVVTKEALLYSDINRWRYRFDFNTGILEQIAVRPVSDYSELVSSGGLGDHTEDDEGNVKQIYAYVTDKHGNLLTNYFDFSAIIMFVPNTAMVTTTTATNAIALSALAQGGNTND
jgi:hypothetical protein